MKAALLPDRGLVKVTGETARDFLNGLITSDTTRLQPGLGRFGALLTPQGKITVDFLITEAPAGHGGGFLIDCPKPLAQALGHKLKFYPLRLHKKPPMPSAPNLSTLPSMMRIASRSASPAAVSTSCMATHSHTRPTWTGLPASTSTRAATSAKKSCRGCSTA